MPSSRSPEKEAESDDLAGVPAPGQVLADKYRIERVIGIGGMGVVLEAHHLHLDDRVAIKMLLPKLAEQGDLVVRFVREGRAAVKIRGDHVARVFDVGTLPNGTPFMVMEFLEGGDLETVMNRRGPLPIPLAVDYLLQACEAIAQAHALGIVHRDLKPENLFVTTLDGADCIKVLDFGISKHLNPTGSGAELSVTRTATVMGSPQYMAPEQMRSARSIDARADIWGLGTLLFTMLTGAPPFAADSLTELCAVILQDPTPSLGLHRQGVPPELEAVVAKCLEKEPAARFANVAQLATALAPFGSPRAKISLERIQRATVPSTLALGDAAGITSGAMVVPPPVAARTGSAWEGTSPHAGRRRRRGLLPLGAVLVGAAAVFGAAFYAARHAPFHSTPSSSPSISPAPSSDPSSPSAMAVASLPAPEPAVASAEQAAATGATAVAGTTRSGTAKPPRAHPPRPVPRASAAAAPDPEPPPVGSAAPPPTARSTLAPTRKD